MCGKYFLIFLRAASAWRDFLVSFLMATVALPAPSLMRSPFRKLWLAQFVSVFGDFLALFGVISLIPFRWHGTPVQITWVMLSFMLPRAVGTPSAWGFRAPCRREKLPLARGLMR